MRRTSLAILGLSLLAALALVAAGCGGGKKSAATTEAPTTQAATTEAATTEAATTEAATTEAATTEAATTEAATTTPNLSGISKNCKDLVDLSQKFSAAFSGSASGADIKKEAALFKQIADKAPTEIRSDFQLIAGYFTKVAEAAGSLKAGQTPDAKTLAKLQKLSTEVDQTKLAAASQHISTWAQKNCHA